MSSLIDVSVVSPMYNEELTVREFVTRAYAALKAMNTSFELIVVDDGSRDKTESILAELSEQYPELKVVCLSRNSGQWAATYAGMQESKGKYVIIIDGDLQQRPEEIHLLVNKNREGFSMVSGLREKRKESYLIRLLPSMIANYMLRRITGCPAKDLGGFKCIEGEMARSLSLRAGQHRLLPALVWLRGGQIAEVPVSSDPRFAGESHYGLSRSFDVLFDISLLWMRNSFKARQIYLFGHISLLVFLFSFGLFAWVLYEKLMFAVDMANRPPFFISLCGFFISMGFMSFGFVLEIISDIQSTVSDRKPYFISKVIQKNS
jgi:glycosyltransferase involved in cell wall biosynthesis